MVQLPIMGGKRNRVDDDSGIKQVVSNEGNGKPKMFKVQWATYYVKTARGKGLW